MLGLTCEVQHSKRVCTSFILFVSEPVALTCLYFLKNLVFS